MADRYEIRERLGRGGYATVYRAFDRLLKSEVALKVVHPGRDPERALARIRREVGVARESLSPHLVRVFELGESNGDLYLTMEVLPGGSLRDRLRQGPLPVPEALRIAEAVLRGLAALHARGVVHRDVTPGNVLFSERGEAKLCDFGLVRRLGRDETKVTLEAGILGTMGYLSPEQLLGKEVGPRSDLYAAGVVLFEMLVGKLPHEAASDLGLRLAAFAVAPDVRRLRPEVPRWLAQVVARLLERRPADRFPSAEAALAVVGKQCAPPRYCLRRRLFRSAAVLLLSLPQTGVLVTRNASFSHLVPLGKTGIAAVDTSGEKLWAKPGVDPEIADRWTRARIKPSGPRLIATVLARPGKWSPEAISTLSFIDPVSGEVVKKEKLPTGETLFPDDPPRFGFSSIKAVDLDRDEVDEVLVSYTHVPEAPSYTVLYSPRLDRARIVFYANGHHRFQGATDLDGDGVPELLFVGINNGWNWVNALAAVKLNPWPTKEENWTEGLAAASPDRIDGAMQAPLLWYAILPRGHLPAPYCLTIDENRRHLTLRYLTGKTWALGFDGFPPGEQGAPPSAERERLRREIYHHLREAERLRRAGAFESAMGEAEAARESAEAARESWLVEYAERLQARILVAEGRTSEAEARFASLAARAEDAPEVAYDAAVAFHLYGDLPRAVAWYERGFGRGAAIDAGKSKHEFLKGEVLALVEEKRYAEALAVVDRFGATYPPLQSGIWIFREYARWRAGERPEMDSSEVTPNKPDLERYWALEFEFAADGEPEDLLRRVDSFLAEKPETRAEILSLRAELLARLGRLGEAADVARSALELVRVKQGRSIVARGHLDLVEERAHRLGEDFHRAALPDRNHRTTSR